MPIAWKASSPDVIRRAEQVQRVKLAVGGGLLIITAFLLIIIFGGDRFASLRNAIGIGQFMAEKRGIYANCQRSADGNRFCGEKPIDERVSRRSRSTDESTDYSRKASDFVPFTLHGD